MQAFPSAWRCGCSRAAEAIIAFLLSSTLQRGPFSFHVKILIVKPSSLGDVLHALPAMSLLRRHFPDASISWLVNDTFAGIVELFPGVDEIIVFRRQRWGQLRHGFELAKFLLELRRRRFDLVIDFQGLFRSGFFTWVTGASRRIGFKAAREGHLLKYHEYRRILKIAPGPCPVWPARGALSRIRFSVSFKAGRCASLFKACHGPRTGAAGSLWWRGALCGRRTSR